jgi:hypothetical protein
LKREPELPKTKQTRGCYICECGHPLDIITVLDQTEVNRIGQSGMLGTNCEQCAKAIEIHLNPGGFHIGYSYFGGSMHFESLCAIEVPGMTVTVGDPDDLEVTIGDRSWHFGIRQPSRNRFIVFARAFANGKAVRLLDFPRLNVRLTGIERDQVRLDWNPDTVICANNFLHLEGPAPALTRAWHYMNNGVL